MRKVVIFLCLGSLLGASVVHPAEKGALTAVPEDMTEHAIQRQVATLREQRYENMPYLDRDYIRATITPEKIRHKNDFIAAGRKTLHDLLQRAIQVHTPLRLGRERIALSQRRILVALRRLFPEMDFEFRQRGGDLSGDQFNSRSYRFTFRQPIFRGGILWNSLLREKADMEANVKEYDKALSDLIYDVANAYFEYNRALQVFKEQEQTVSRMKHFVEISERKFKEEIISEIEHLNVQSLYGQMQYDFETVKQELELAQLELYQFLDLTVHDRIEVAPFYDIEDLLERQKSREKEGGQVNEEPSFEGHVNVPSLGDLVDLAYEHRPELQVESFRLQAARLEERVKWGELLPQADLVLEFGKLGEAFDVNELDPGLRHEFRLFLELKWNAAGNTVDYSFENNETAPSVTQFLQGSGSHTQTHSLKVQLLDGLEAFSEAKDAEVEKINQIVELEKAEKEVIQDVKQAYFEYQKARIQVESTLQRVEYRERLVRLAEHRLGQNEIQISEYLQAEIDLLREKTELHKALKDYFTAKAQLNRAVGIREFLPIGMGEGHGRQ